MKVHKKAKMLGRSRFGTVADVDVAEEIGKNAFGIAAIVAILIGVWSIACIVGVMFRDGGPLALLRNWFTAILGS